MRFPWQRKSAEFVVSVSDSGRPLVYHEAFDLARHTNEIVNIAREWLARQAAEPALVVYTDDKPDPTHPLSKAFTRPSGADNAHLTQSDVWRFVARQLSGPTKIGCFLLVVKDRAGQVAEVWPRSDAHVRPVKDSRTFVSHYEWRNGQSWQRVPTGVEVVWLRDVGDDLYEHHSPLHDVQRAIKTDSEAAKWQEFLLHNMGMSGGLLGLEGVDRQTAEAVRDFINTNLMGSHNAGKVEVTGAKVSKTDLRQDVSDIDFTALKDRLELYIASAYGIPAELLQLIVTAKQGEGLSGNAYREKRKIAYQNRVIPWLKVIEERVGLVCAPMYGIDPETIHFDLSGIDALDNSPLEKAQTLTAYMAAIRSVASLDERRALATRYGVELDEVGDDTIPEQADRAQRQAFTERLQLSGSGPRESKSIPSPDPYEAAMTRTVAGLFAKERANVAEAIGNLPKSAESDALLRKVIDAIEAGLWEEGASDVLGLVLADAGQETAETFGVAFGITDPRAVEAVSKRVTELAGNVTQTTVDEIRALVSSKLESGATLRDLADAILDTEIGPWGSMRVDTRAATIARTEVHGARGDGSYQGALTAQDEIGSMVKTWLSAGDGVTRDSHADLDGETVALEEAFSNGLMYPGDPAGGPEDVINCRCVLLYAAKEGSDA